MRPPVEVSVSNGDLLFVREPLMLGHYASLRLTGTERIVDSLLAGALSASLGEGAYPTAVGEQRIFVNAGVNRDNPLQLPRPAAAIVVGLGAEGKLRPTDLARAARDAVIAWSRQIVATPRDAPAPFEIACTLMGSGGVGVAVGPAALSIAQGVSDANERLANDGLPVAGALRVIELYLDRATEAWRALRAQAEASPDDFAVSPAIRSVPGALPRALDAGYRGADYDFISALTESRDAGEPCIAYTLDTRRARTEVHAQAAHTKELRALIASASSASEGDAGHALSAMLIPREMEPFLGGTSDMLLEVDASTAGIPWEILDGPAQGASDERPWAIRAKLLRKLRTADFRVGVADADADASALVIGEPACDPKRYPRLPGARDEALAVAQCLSGRDALGSERVVALVSPDDREGFGPDARTVVGALLGRDWRIVHIAGHGALPEWVSGESARRGAPRRAVEARGVVLSDGAFLGSPEIARMRVVPELVFVNCCHLGARSPAELLVAEGIAHPGLDRARFAAGVAEALIRIGVRCVVAAGWAVDDGASGEFASRFYDALVRGRRFIDAVAEAREAAYVLGGNTWAAYQCYGDPDWRFARNVADAQRPQPSPVDEFAGIAEPAGLVLALQTIAVRCRYQKAAVREQRAKLRHLEARFASGGCKLGAVAEAFGRAFDAVGDRSAAMEWYARALAANDGSASLRAVEQLGNLRARAAWAAVDAATRAVVRRRAPSATALSRARDEIACALRTLEQVRDLAPTIERESLCGSAWKRLALIEGAARRTRQETAAIRRMKLHYGRAEALARAACDDQLFYPALNRMAAELVLDAGNRRWRGFDRKAVEAVRASLVAKARDDPDFWSVAGLTELRIYLALAGRALASCLDAILAEFGDLHARIATPAEWGSVFDQLQFVLPKYAARATAAEKSATKGLVARLARYAKAGTRRSRRST